MTPWEVVERLDTFILGVLVVDYLRFRVDRVARLKTKEDCDKTQAVCQGNLKEDLRELKEDIKEIMVRLEKGQAEFKKISVALARAGGPGPV